MLTAAERRGLSLLVLVFALGAVRDLWNGSRLAAPGPRLDPAVGAAAVRDSATAAAPAADSSGGFPDRTVDVNRAGAAELDRLPGIGPVLAGRILEHRARHGPFRGPEDLLAVPGIGPRLLERLRPNVRFGSAPP